MDLPLALEMAVNRSILQRRSFHIHTNLKLYADDVSNHHAVAKGLDIQLRSKEDMRKAESEWRARCVDATLLCKLMAGWRDRTGFYVLKAALFDAAVTLFSESAPEFEQNWGVAIRKRGQWANWAPFCGEKTVRGAKRLPVN